MNRKFLAGVICCAFFCCKAFGQTNFRDQVVSAFFSGASAATLSDAQIEKMAHEIVDWTDVYSSVAGPNDPYTRRLQRVVGNYDNLDQLHLNYKVYLTPKVGAIAYADGSIRVSSVLMDVMTDDELIAVIAHQIGHIRNHDVKSAIRSVYINEGLEALSASGSTYLALDARQQRSLSDYMLAVMYSEKQELRADDFCYDFLKNNGFDVMAEVTAFKKMASFSQDGMNNHYQDLTRIMRIANMAKADGLYRDTELLYPVHGGDFAPVSQNEEHSK